MGEWGVLTLLGPGDDIPEPLLTVRALWENDPRRVPALLKNTRFTWPPAPYVVCWPLDVPPPDLDGVVDLDGAAIGEPALLHCFACGADFDAIYPDGGIPGFPFPRARIFTGCPACGAEYFKSKVQALAIGPALPPGTREARRAGRAQAPVADESTGARPALLVAAVTTYVVMVSFVVIGTNGGPAELATLWAGVVAFLPAFAVMHGERGFRIAVAIYGGLTLLTLFGPGVFLLPSVLVMGAATFTQPPPPERTVARAVATAVAVSAVVFLAALAYLLLA